MKHQANEPTERDHRDALYDQFVTLLTRHDGAIRRFVRYLLPIRDGVDDVMQEVSLECWRKFVDFEMDACGDGSEFVRWACVIARYKVLSWQRDRSRDRLVFREGALEALSKSALESLDGLEQERNAVDSCLKKLPADRRRLVLSVYSPGESVARIARETGEEASRLYGKLNSLRKMLLKCVQNELVSE